MTWQFWFTLGLIVLFVVVAGIDVALIVRTGRPKMILLSTALAFAGFVVGVLAPVYNSNFWSLFTLGAFLILVSAGVRQWPWQKRKA